MDSLCHLKEGTCEDTFHDFFIIGGSHNYFSDINFSKANSSLIFVDLTQAGACITRIVTPKASLQSGVLADTMRIKVGNAFLSASKNIPACRSGVNLH
jgi:hypothetical protein